jgi:hypothetical protein
MRHHMEAVVAKADAFMARLSSIARFVKPEFLRSLWYSGATTMLYASELWGGRLSTNDWDKMEAAHARGCRTVLRLVRSTNGYAAMSETGMRTLRTLAVIKNIKLEYLLSTMPGHHPLLSGRFKHPPNSGADTEALTRHGGLLPTTIPPSPPPAVFDKVAFFTPPAVRKVSASDEKPKRFAANNKQRERVEAHLATVTGAVGRFVGWSDGSVERVDGIDYGGAGIAIWSPDNDRVHDGEFPTTKTPCSYSAECAAAMALFDSMSTKIAEWRAIRGNERRPATVAIYSDGQSWLTHAENGPQHSAVMNPAFWQRLELLVHQVDRLAMGFMFAHCDDPEGDHVDAVADGARMRFKSEGITLPATWHVDARRPFIATYRRLRDVEQLKLCPVRYAAYQELKTPDVLDDPIPLIGMPPPKELCRRDAHDLSQIRCGAWQKLGRHAVVHGVPPAKCKFCSVMLSRGGGKPVLHMFECGGVEVEVRYRVGDLFSDDPKHLVKVLEFCRNFCEEPDGTAWPPRPAPTPASTGPPSTAAPTQTSTAAPDGSTTPPVFSGPVAPATPRPPVPTPPDGPAAARRRTMRQL